MVTRRGFLASLLALGAAPAVVRAGSIMRIKPVVTLDEIHFYEGVDFHPYEGIKEISGLDAHVPWWRQRPGPFTATEMQVMSATLLQYHLEKAWKECVK